MVVSREVEIQLYRGVGGQRRRGFGALAQVIDRTAIPFLRKYIVPAAKRIGADLLEFVAPQMQRLLRVERIWRQLQRVWEDRFWENSWVVVVGRRKQP